MLADGVTFRRMLVGIALAVLVVLNVALIFLNIHKSDREASAQQGTSQPQSTPVTTIVTSPAAATASPSTSAGSSSVATSTVPSTTVPSTTAPSTTTPRTTAPRTTVPSTRVSSSRPPAPSQPLRVSAESAVARPYQTLRLTGRYEKSNTLLRAQQFLGGRWTLFPLPTMTDGSGKFSTYVELGQRGQHRLRMVCPSTGAKSNVVTVTVR
jgi:cytoskeletal protein RodZ